MRPVSLTLEAWVALDATAEVRVILAKPAGTRTTSSYLLWLEHGVLKGAVNNADGRFEPFPEARFALALGRWYHVAFTFDDAIKMQALYIDGQLVDSKAVTKSIEYDAAPRPLLLGCGMERGSRIGFFRLH